VVKHCIVWSFGVTIVKGVARCGLGIFMRCGSHAGQSNAIQVVSKPGIACELKVDMRIIDNTGHLFAEEVWLAEFFSIRRAIHSIALANSVVALGRFLTWLG
jgi:hypothetical protein